MHQNFQIHLIQIKTDRNQPQPNHHPTIPLNPGLIISNTNNPGPITVLPRLQECNCVSGCYDGARFGFILCKARGAKRARSGKMWLNSRDREFVLFRIGQIRAKICSFTASANSIKRRYRRTNSCTLAVIWRLMGPLGFQWRRMQKPC